MTGGVDRLVRASVTVGTALALAGTVHSWWNLRQLRVLPKTTPETNAPSNASQVSVLIPARDEAARIGRCLLSVRAQRWVNLTDILVFDDRSSDGTAQVVQHHLTDQRVRLIESADEPPAGWLGKAWACHQLASQASGEILVFIDADVTLNPDALARIVAHLQTGHADAVSPYPRQVAITAPERLIQPLLQWSWATLLPLRAAERSDRSSLVAANGQVLAVTRDAYDECGGHQAIRARVLDDIALFQQLKRVHRRGVLTDGTDVATCRMYEDWPSLRDGYCKSLWAATRSPAGGAGVAAVLSLAYVVPAAAMILRGSRTGALGYAAAVAGRALVADRVGGRVWPDSLLHPASIAAFDYLLARSWAQRVRGTLSWKDRSVPSPVPRPGASQGWGRRRTAPECRATSLPPGPSQPTR
jgi:glycosyltransferase involved in cell wall biosynthesis